MGDTVLSVILLLAWLAVTAFVAWALWTSGHHVWSALVAVLMVASVRIKP